LIEILKPGLYTTIQDQGRQQCTHLGVPISGAMDSECASDANRLLRNEPSNSLIECTIIGPEIKFHKDTAIVITGAVIQPFVNGHPSFINKVIRIYEGDVLSFGKVVKGARFYIGIRGGFLSKTVLGSQSACITSNILGVLKKGDLVPHAYYDGFINQPTLFIRNVGNTIIKLMKGPEFDLLNNVLLDLGSIFSTVFDVRPESNRMAYRVSHGLNIKHKKSILSSGTLPGTIQLTPHGDLIFLMRDAQTTGGYPRIFQMTDDGICDMSQLKSGDKFTVHLNE